MNHDFLAIGDIVTDAFIRLQEASVHCDVNREHCTISMSFGDKIPYEDVWVVPAVGNSPNAAVSAARLGLRSALYSNLGDDLQGKECLDALRDHGVATEFLSVHPGMKTNQHYVLWFEDDRTILIRHEAYRYALPDLGAPAWIYLSSLGEAGEALHDDLATYLAEQSGVKLAFQPGTFQIRLGAERLKDIYARTEIFFCNKEEAQRVLKTEEGDEKKLMAGLAALGPKTVVMTDGPKGAYAHESGKFWFMPPYPDPKPPRERTGAGDAFASTVTSAIALGMPLEDALRWGPINSMAVVQEVGAQQGLLTREKLEMYLAAAPSDYMPKAI